MTRRLPLASARAALAAHVRPLDRESRPVYAVWELTLRCDLACRHCGSRAGRPREDELGTEASIELVRALADLGVQEITLIGGEAYLRDDWLDVVAAIRSHQMRCSIVTGGRGMDRALARRAKEAGLDGAAVSLDGLEAAHDSVRGLDGSWARAVAAARHLRGAGIPISFNTQVNRRTVADLPALLDVIVASGAHAWQLALTVPMGRAVDDPSFLLQPYELDHVYPTLAALAVQARDRGVRLVRGNNLGYFGPHEVDFEADPSAKNACGCGAGRDVIGIEADGSIKGCPSLATRAWAGGSVRDAALVDLWERAEPLRRLRDPRAGTSRGFCASCYYASECGGGCTWMAHSLFGVAGDNPYCHHRVLELKARGLRERVERVAPAPGLPFDRAEHRLVVEPWDTAEDVGTGSRAGLC